MSPSSLSPQVGVGGGVPGWAQRAHGGRVEAFHYAFEEDDVYTIWNLPDPIAKKAVTMAAFATGVVTRLVTVALLTPEEIDEVAKRPSGYRAPGA